MDFFPYGYQRIHEASWAWLSSLLMIALYFKFNRFWSIRNLDLLLLILVAPGILLVNYREPPRSALPRPAPPMTDPDLSITTTGGVPPDVWRISHLMEGEPEAGEAALRGPSSSGETASEGVPGQLPRSDEAGGDRTGPVPEEALTPADLVRRSGYIWLFSCGLILLARMLLDPLLVRRPLLEPNISPGGLVFLGGSLLLFMFADIAGSRPQPGQLSGAIGAMKLVQREAASEEDRKELLVHGPGYALLHVIPSIPTFRPASANGEEVPGTAALEYRRLEIAAKSIAIAGQIALVSGLLAIGYFHFSGFRTGAGMAVIWLLLPSTIMYSGNAYHVLPAALIVWGVALYRQPMVAGLVLGLATGVSYYPLFLLPLWLSFYWESRVSRFVWGFVAALAVCVAGLVFTSEDVGHFFGQLQAMFGFWLPRVDRDLLRGIWVLGWDPLFRLPLLVAFVVLCLSFVVWPLRKDLGTLMAYTSAVMIAVQFWHGYEGGTFVAWYMPLFVATVFRPNLSDRLAATQIPSHRRQVRMDPPQRVSPAA